MVALVAAVLVALAPLAPAAAHSELDRSDPPAGGMVPVGRTELTVWFGEPVSAPASSFRLRLADGVEVAADVAFTDARVVRLTTPPLARGTYVLDWHTVSLEDGHPSTGTLVFGAGLRPDAVTAQGTGLPSGQALALRWLDLTGLLLAVGALALAGALGRLGPSGAGVRRRVGALGLLAAAGCLYAGLVTPFLRTPWAGAPIGDWLGQGWLTLTETPWGRLWLLREGALLVTVLALLRGYLDARPGRAGGRSVGDGTDHTLTVVAGLGLLAATLLQSLGGHPASLAGGSLTAVLMATGHVLAAGVWVGGLVLLLATLRAGRRTGGAGLPWQAAWWAFSPLAAVAAVVLVATGVYQTGRHLPGLSAVDTTVYGATVAAKVALVVAALALAAVNTLLVDSPLFRRLGARSLGGRRLTAEPRRVFARTVIAEALVLVAAVLAAGVLTSVPTARDVAQATRPTTPHADNVDGLFLTFETVPEGRAGTLLVLKARSTILPDPAPVQSVDVTMAGPGTPFDTALAAVEEGRYEATTRALAAGAWTATVRLHRQGRPDSVSVTRWTVSAHPTAEWTPLRAVTTLLSSLLLAGLAVVLLRRPRRGVPEAPTPERVPEPVGGGSP